MTWSPPTPEEQVQFLRNIQRLLAEGLFVASYKFALVHALADLAVLHGDDTGRPLEIHTSDIAAKFVEPLPLTQAEFDFAWDSCVFAGVCVSACV